jgi:integrase
MAALLAANLLYTSRSRWNNIAMEGYPMASLQKKGDSWHCQFTFQHQRRTWVIGAVGDREAKAIKAKVEYLLMRIKQHLLEVPAGMDIVTFVEFDGKAPAATPRRRNQDTTFARFRDAYINTFGNGAIEENTLYTAKIHLAHLAATLGEQFSLSTLVLADLQRHIDRRRKKVAAITIKKEIDTFRGAWNWAGRMGQVEGSFPSGDLVFPKGEEKLPFMTWAQIERRVGAGGDPQELWECLFLREHEIENFLDFVQKRKAPAWVYPMCVMAAHTGARRSEMLRAERQDVDFEAGIITLREKKRVRGKVTTRRVPMSTRLKNALTALPAVNGRLFGERSVQAAQKAFVRIVGKHTSGAKNVKTKARTEAQRRTKWAVVKGYHVLRHSFISALANKGIDQRIIDEMVGHQTESMRRRYRHLYPQTVADAVKQVFG